MFSTTKSIKINNVDYVIHEYILKVCSLFSVLYDEDIKIQEIPNYKFVIRTDDVNCCIRLIYGEFIFSKLSIKRIEQIDAFLHYIGVPDKIITTFFDNLNIDHLTIEKCIEKLSNITFNDTKIKLYNSIFSKFKNSISPKLIKEKASTTSIFVLTYLIKQTFGYPEMFDVPKLVNTKYFFQDKYRKDECLSIGNNLKKFAKLYELESYIPTTYIVKPELNSSLNYYDLSGCENFSEITIRSCSLDLFGNTKCNNPYIITGTNLFDSICYRIAACL